MTDPELVDVLRAVAEGDHTRAESEVERVRSGPLASALRRHLRASSGDGVYDEPTGFDTFISHGTNPALYAATIAQLRRCHDRTAPASVLDVGCGDGRVTAAVLGAGTRSVDLVEPSTALLADAAAAVVRTGADVTAHGVSIEDHLAGLDPRTRWDLTQSTFALHTVEPVRRSLVLAELAGRTELLAIVDFDVPAIAVDSDAWLAHLVERYEVGIAEYAEHPDAVDGFLVPVLLGQLDPSRPRHTFEQPASAWVEQVETAGFTDVRVEPVAPYWWAPAFLLTARGAPGGRTGAPLGSRADQVRGSGPT